MPAKAGTSFFSSKNMLTIADCHADVTLNLIQGSIGFSLPEPLFIIMFAPSGISHTRTFTSFECSVPTVRATLQ